MPSLGNTPRPAYVYDTETDTWVPIGVGAHTHDTLYVNQNIIDAKGDLIVGTSDNSYDRLAAGNSGDTLVADSSATTGLRWQSGVNVNNLINGGADVWQRGTSVSVSASSNVYTADRWMASTEANQATTVSRQATSDTTNLPFIQYCIRFQRNSGQTGTGNMWLRNAFETAATIPLVGRSITFSYYARAGANFSGTIKGILQTGTGTDQPANAYTGALYPVDSGITLTTTWQRFSHTVTLGTTVNEIAPGWVWTPSGTAGTNDYFEVTGVQIELGSVATVFKRSANTLAGELAACQRYYLNFSITAAPAYFLNGIARSTTVATCYFPSPVEMRVVPTSIDVSGFRIFNSQNGTAYTGGTTTLEAYNNKVFQVNYTHGSAVFTNGTNIIGGLDATSSYIRFNAEL